MSTYTDDTAILTSDPDPLIFTRLLQNHLNMLSKWCNTWKIKVNELKSTHITYINGGTATLSIVEYETIVPLCKPHDQ